VSVRRFKNNPTTKTRRYAKENSEKLKTFAPLSVLGGCQVSQAACPFCINRATMLVMVSKELLEILVCPACKQALEYRLNPESLKCTQCRRVYAVKDDIPIMLIDEAKIE
jgi:uncharacterized protein YbaR (Trm112 family)